MTERRMVSRRTALGACIALVPGLHARTKATAFALIGDRYHNSDYIRTGLLRTIEREMDVTVDFCDEVKMLNAETLKGYKLLIVLRDGMLWPDGYQDESSNAGYVATGRPPLVSDPPVPKMTARQDFWITAEQCKPVKQFVERGGGALLMHNVTYISPHSEDFRDVLGAVTEGHPPIRKFKVRVVNHDHPITLGVNDFIVTDEQHYMKYQKDAKHLLLESVNEDDATYKDLGSKSAAGWAYHYRYGRVWYL